MNRFRTLSEDKGRTSSPLWLSASSTLSSRRVPSVRGLGRRSLSAATQATQSVLDAARMAARGRVQQAYLRLNGTHPQHGEQWRREGEALARRLIDTGIDIDTVVSKLDTMHTVLSSERRFSTQSTPSHCALRSAYYDSGDRLIHVCPGFASASLEQQTRTLIHEAAHAAGIGQSQGESYVVQYDCSFSYNDRNVADGWAHFVHCLLGLPPDPPTVIRGGTSRGQSWSRQQQTDDGGAVSPDAFVVEVLAFFYTERLQESQLNSQLRELAARMFDAAVEASNAMDLVPRPPGGRPGFAWLISQIVQAAYRRLIRERRIYQSVRVSVARNFRSEYELAKMSEAQSVRGFQFVRAAALPGVAFQIRDVPMVRQPSDRTSWAAVAATMVGWQRHDPSPDPRAILNALDDRSYLQLLDADRGPNRAQHRRLYELLGLRSIEQGTANVEAWARYLRQYGPLAMAIAFEGDSVSRAVAVVGLEGDGTANGTRVFLRDPSGFLRAGASLSFQALLAQVENGAATPLSLFHFQPAQGVAEGQALHAHSFQEAPEQVINEPMVITARPGVIRGAGWRQGSFTFTVLDYRGEPMIGHRLFVQFRSTVGEPQTLAADIQGGSAIFSNVWVRPQGTMYARAVSTGTPTESPAGTVHYTLPANAQMRFQATQAHRDVEITATNGAEAARQAGASGTAGVNFEVLEVGGTVSSEERRTRSASESKRYTVRFPTAELTIQALP